MFAVMLTSGLDLLNEAGTFTSHEADNAVGAATPIAMRTTVIGHTAYIRSFGRRPKDLLTIVRPSLSASDFLG